MRRPLATLTLLATALASVPGVALAEEGGEEELDPDRWEKAILPALAGNSDLGFLFGVYSVVAKFDEDYRPYRWRGSLRAIMSVKDGPDGAELPLHNHAIQMDFPGLRGGRLRLTTEAGFSKNIIVNYHGLGNASRGTLSGFATLHFGYSVIETYAGSKLEEDIDAAAAEPASGRLTPSNRPPDTLQRRPEALYGAGDHALLGGVAGLVWDTRDHEFHPTVGSFHELSLRGSPGRLTGADHLYWGTNVALRGYLSLWDRTLVLAARATADLARGRVPFDEQGSMVGLERFSAFGGGRGVRGIPAGRYRGKAKVLGSVELRSVFARVMIRGTPLAFGAGAFLDAGRLWSDIPPRSDLDGHGVGLKYGTGGGPRFHWGEALVIRGDVAWSPDSDPVGFYLDVNQAF